LLFSLQIGLIQAQLETWSRLAWRARLERTSHACAKFRAHISAWCACFSWSKAWRV